MHVHPGAEELGRVYRPALPILAGMEQFAAAVRDLRVEPRWREWTAAARADYEAWQRHGPMPGALDLGECIAHLRERVPDAIVTNGAGNFSVWVHRFWRWHAYPQPARADERGDGLRRPGRGRREERSSPTAP